MTHASEHAWRDAYAHPTPWATEFAPLTLPAMFRQSVAAFGDRRVADFMGARVSYRQLGDWVSGFAGAMQARGLAKGDRVGLFLPNVPDYLIAYYGVLEAGGIVVNMSPLYSVDELRHQLQDSGARIIVTVDVPQLYKSAMALLADGTVDRVIVGSLSGWLPGIKRTLFRLLKRKDMAVVETGGSVERLMTLATAGAVLAPVTIAPDDVALIQYTGGTTGTPKGAMLTHQNLTANARQVNAIDPNREAPDRIVGVLPFFHVFANTAVLNRTILNGGMIAMLPRFEAKATLATVERVKATALPGVPTMYQALLDHKDMARTDFASLRVCISGGAPLPDVVRDRFEAAAHARVVEGYGLTESAGVVSCNPYAGGSRGGTIGQPIPGTHLRLVDREDATRDAPPGEPGELVVRGPQIMAGYWGHPEKDADTFVDGWLRTGDVATIDADGYVRIVDRLKDMIAVGGFKVFPSQIEHVLYQHDAVHEAIVIGVPDAYHGERPKGYVTLNPGAQTDGAAIADWVNARVGKHERVVSVEVRDALPKTLVGKLSRKELVAEARARA